MPCSARLRFPRTRNTILSAEQIWHSSDCRSRYARDSVSPGSSFSKYPGENLARRPLISVGVRLNTLMARDSVNADRLMSWRLPSASSKNWASSMTVCARCISHAATMRSYNPWRDISIMTLASNRRNLNFFTVRNLLFNEAHGLLP